MGTRIPEETIERIQKSNDILEIVGEYVQLKKQGRNYFGLCPFHDEKSPSFSVSAEKQIYRCFGCGKGGNVISFLMEIEGFSFIETIKNLADRTNIELPQLPSSPQNDHATKEKEIMKEGHELLARLYHHCLTNTEYGQKAKEYLYNRGFTDEMIDHFQIGFAPESWDFATSFLQKRNFTLQTMEEAGILAKREFDRKFYDRFRSRIMFPIWDTQGKNIAFGGRIMGDGEPKYLNSPETRIFHKSKTLYGYHMARPDMRKDDKAILFEGYVDVIAAWKAGITNAVATLGTSLTQDQAKLLSRNVNTVVICYDSDQAGINAAFRATEHIEKMDCNVRIAQMPPGLDPDDYIQNYGGERFKQDVLGASLTVMAFKMQFMRRGKNLQDEGERMRYIEEILHEIAKLPKAVERDHYLRQLAEEFNLSLDALKQQQYQAFVNQKRNKDNVGRNRENNPKKFIGQSTRLLPAFHNAERILLAHMLKDVSIAEKVEELLGGAFNIDEYSAIAAYLYAYYAEGHTPDISLFLERVDDQRLKQVVTELAMLTINEDISDQELYDYVHQIQKYPKLLKIQEKEKDKNRAEREQDMVEAARIAMEIVNLKKALKSQ
ncbi:DNA primase [Pseudalkalibacillus berkeleyi]|uniref:DNA primase n=1 Tax=Pseudalkalibacillus berkeleyi TaxID=1069813 RepID=A0ABS9GYY0_9BACL|nr:DNA primase [Pseudalkalibacillus berkeleyi]MCF6137953.1 DNA primase [Pseudalkalibacillus berkeleyi]